MGKKFTRLAAVLVALVVAISVAVPAVSSFAATSTTTVTLDVTYCQTEARSMLSSINSFRTSETDAWAWDSSDSEKVYYSDLGELTYSYDLEAIAMQRAAEIVLLFAHTRTDGTSLAAMYGENTIVYSYYGENIAAGYGTAMDAAQEAFETWLEADASYSGQGHRRNMLSADYNCVGIACVYYNGYYYWVQEFGYTTDTTNTYTEPNDSTTTASVDVSSSMVTVKSYSFGTSSVAVDEGGTGSVDTMATFKIALSYGSYSTFPTSGVTVTANLSWTSSDTSIATVSDGTVTGVSAGSTSITAPALGGTFTVPVTVSHIYTSTVTSPTCTEDGYTTYTCSYCGDSYTGDTTDALGHDYVAVVTSPTCEADGYTTYTCSRCGDSYTDDTTDALGHDYDFDNVAWTWAEDYSSATATVTCTNDGSHTLTVEATITSEVTTAATCVSTGVRTYTAKATFTLSGSAEAALATAAADTSTVTVTTTVTETIPIDSDAHDYVGVYTDPTCEDDGYTTYTCSRCGDSYVVTAEGTALGHTAAEAVTENAVDPTCTEDGSYDTVTYCSVCGDELSRTTTTVAATGHSYTTYVSDGNATCTADGTKTATCDNGCGETDTVTDEGSVLGHDYVATATSATCTEPGYTTYTCTRCGDTYTTTEAEALGHDYVATVTTEPTCTEEGVTTYTCSRCGDSYTEPIEALGHSFEVLEVIEPTCTEDGYTIYTCTACNNAGYQGDYTDALGHDYEAVVTEPTCILDGYTTYTCTRCGDTYVADIVYALGHDYVDVYTEATCEDDGYYTLTCSRCNDTYTAVVEGTALGHDYVAIVTEPTCTEGGYTTYTCSRCGDTYVADEVEALGHDYVISETDATCTEPGTTTYTCSRGDDEYVVTGEALGHDWVVVEVVTEPTCEEDGEAIYECSRCGEQKTDAVAATGHDYEEAERVEATCTEDGYAVYVCANDADHTYTEVLAATGHSYEVVAELAATCTEDGYATYVCSVCGDTYTEEFAATGHSWAVSSDVTFSYDTAEDGTVTFTGATFTFTCATCGEIQTVEAASVTTTVASDGSYVGSATVADPDGAGEYTATASVTVASDDDSTTDDTTTGSTTGTTADSSAADTLAATGDDTGFAVASIALMGGFALVAGLAARKRRNAA